jgi:pyruvate kinase
LCQDVKPGNRILLADGSISIQVDQILSGTELRGTVLNTKKLGQRKNCNLPGVKVRLPVLTPHDVEDVQRFACRNHMDFVAGESVSLIEKGQMRVLHNHSSTQADELLPNAGAFCVLAASFVQSADDVR